ncbi:MAG: MATE family efflux transporter [Romboutsia sp.]
MNEKKKILLNGNIDKIFLKYLINSVLGMLVVSFYILVDTMFVGRGVGSDGLAALNICLPAFNILNSIGLLFGMGGATALSISVGKNDILESRRIFTQTILLAVVTGIIISISGVGFTKEIGYMLGATEESIYLVNEYLSGMLFMGFSYILVHTVASFIRNDNRPRLVMVATVSSGIINIILDYIFIFHLNLGIKGAALATSISSFLNLLILCSHFRSKKSTLKLIKFNPRVSRLVRILSNGMPSFIIEISSGIVIYTFNIAILTIIGKIGVSAYSIIANVALVCASIFTGIAQAIQPIISINYGAQQYERVEIVKKRALKYAFTIGLIFYLMGILFPTQIVSIFTLEKGEIVDITINGMMYYFLAFLIMGSNIVLGSYYQSIEYTITSNIISLGRGIIFLIGSLMILPKIFGVNGIWISVVFAEAMTLICIYTYIQFKNYNNKIIEN